MPRFEINTKVQTKLFERIEIVINGRLFKVREHLSAEFMHEIDSYHTDPIKKADPKGALRQFCFWTGCDIESAKDIDARILVQAMDFFLDEIRNPSLAIEEEELKNSKTISGK